MDKERTNIKQISAPRDFVLFLSTIIILGIAIILPGMIGDLGAISSSWKGDLDSNVEHPSVEKAGTQAIAVALKALTVKIDSWSSQPGYFLETPSFDPWSKDDDDRVLAKPIRQATAHQKKSPFNGIINEVAGRYEVDPHLIRAIIFAESGFNPKARSKKGACGLMQLMPATAKALGVENVDDPEENIDGGVRYFKSLLDRFDGDVSLALAAYNAGSRHVRNYEGVPPFRATRIYIKKVLTFRNKFKAEMATISKKMV